jgi:hypothetical protein
MYWVGGRAEMEAAQVDDSRTGQFLRGILGAEDMAPGRAA